jgi:hypothetical protein
MQGIAHPEIVPGLNPWGVLERTMPWEAEPSHPCATQTVARTSHL